MDIKYIIKDYFRSKNLQDFINRRFKDDSSIVLRKEKIEYISYGDNLHFSPRSFGKWYCVVEEMIYDDTHHIEDICPNDIVIDIGANVGGFSLLAATRTKNKIIAIEPVLYEVLVENISLNNREKQILPFKLALGSGEKLYIPWGEGSYADTVSLSNLLELAGGRCDFLKMDCEGGEWDILKCNELDKIGRVAMEYHCYTKEHDVNILVQQFEDYGFDVKRVPLRTWKPTLKGDMFHIGLMYCTRKNWKHS